MKNSRNFTGSINYKFGCNLFSEDTQYLIQTVSIPGISVGNMNNDSRQGLKVLQADTLTYNPINITFILDEKFECWIEVIRLAQRVVDPETAYMTPIVGQAWIEFYDTTNNYLFKLQINNCYIESISDLNMDVKDNNYVTFDISFMYDNYEIIK